MKPDRIPLAAKYGKLRVLGEKMIYGRRIVRVICTCGDEKEVHAHSLTSGSTTSCGKIGCKNGTVQIKRDKSYRPLGSRSFTPTKLRNLWRDYQSGEMSGTAMAAKYKVTKNVVYSTLIAVMRAGGIDPYFALVAKRKQ